MAAMPFIAACAAFAAWLILPTPQVMALNVEGGLVETWTMAAYALALLAMTVVLVKSGHKPTALATLVVVAALAAREMDLHIHLTGTSVLRVSYYLRGSFTPGKAVALLVVSSILACAAYLVLREAPRLRKRLAAGEPVAFSLLVMAATVLVAKALDRTASIVVEDFGWDLTPAAIALIQGVEEALELALPLVILLASLHVIRVARAPRAR